VVGSQPATEPEAPPPRTMVAQPPVQQVEVPAEPQVVLPEVAVNLPKPAAPAAKAKRRAGRPARAGEAEGKAGKKGGRPAGRETFGTTVAFARNPREAARSAAEERKLTFLLHVSGNFEEARFT